MEPFIVATRVGLDETITKKLPLLCTKIISIGNPFPHLGYPICLEWPGMTDCLLQKECAQHWTRKTILMSYWLYMEMEEGSTNSDIYKSAFSIYYTNSNWSNDMWCQQDCKDMELTALKLHKRQQTKQIAKQENNLHKLLMFWKAWKR